MTPMREYRQSKLADLIFSVELHRRVTAQRDKVIPIAATARSKQN